ncbi:hypothetical protein BP6252_03458 [Coleophoma cylindrospora]|uniref:Uncharacterized protein n=1 Tax=Coleophoma cylindrospora TaxID=1849047 RepID=A0A3D8S7S4_9HELO|nr:hypothetical protein BP6252_03458 [Coleophoma cylindrospora]
MSSSFNFTQCAIDAQNAFLSNPGTTWLRDSQGNPTNNITEAWGVSFEACNNMCGPLGGHEAFQWTTFSAGVASWLLPWLALTAQLPYETKDGLTNLTSLVMAIGSPILITYSLCITILNSRWLNKRFASLIKENRELGGHQEDTIKAAWTILTESQHIPIAIRETKGTFAELVTSPENKIWWQTLREEVQRSKRVVTYSLLAQTGWVSITELISIIDFFMSPFDNATIGLLGVAINSLWMWMIPITLGWVWVGTQESAKTIEFALRRASTKAIIQGQACSERMVGFTDTTGEIHRDFELLMDTTEDIHNGDLERQFELHSLAPQRSRSINGHNPMASEDMRLLQKPAQTDVHCYSSPSSQIDNKSQITEEWNEVVSAPIKVSRHISGYEAEAGPIFNYARPWFHLQTSLSVMQAFSQLNRRIREKRTVSGCDWNEREMKENLTGNPTQMAAYIFPRRLKGSTERKRLPGLLSMILTATILAITVQWGTTGAAIMIAYLTPVIGLGCESGSYILYGTVATLIWFLLVTSAYLSYYYQRNFIPPKEPAVPSSIDKHMQVFLYVLIPTTRISGLVLAWCNSVYLLAISVIQFTNLYNSCWCEGCVLGHGREKAWVILWASGAQIASAATPSWIAAVIISLLTLLCAGVFFLNARGQELIVGQSQ